MENYLPEILSSHATKPSIQKKKKKKKQKKKPVSITQNPQIETRPKFEITTEEKEDLEKGIVNEKLMDFMNDVAINGLKDLGFTNTSSIRREDITFSIEEIIPNPDNETEPVLEPPIQSIVGEEQEQEHGEEEQPLEQPYDTSFEEFLTKMKETHNSDFSRKQKGK